MSMYTQNSAYPFTGSDSIMDDTVQSHIENSNVDEKPSFVLHGIQEKNKAAILLVKHKRRPESGKPADTQSRIFGDGVDNTKPTQRAPKKNEPLSNIFPGNNEFKLAKPAPSNMGSIIAGDAPDSLPKSKPAMAGTGNRRNVTSFKLGGSPMDPK